MKIRQATASDADEIARIINAAFEIEQEFRRGERISPPEVTAVESSTNPAFKYPIRVVNMEKVL